MRIRRLTSNNYDFTISLFTHLAYCKICRRNKYGCYYYNQKNLDIHYPICMLHDMKEIKEELQKAIEIRLKQIEFQGKQELLF